MKLGYKIIIVLLIIIAFFYIRARQKHELARFETKVKKLVTDIRHRDYFEFHQELAPKLTQEVSIESIQKFMAPLKIERDSTIEIIKLKEQNSSYYLDGKINSKKIMLPFKMVFCEDNHSRLLLLNTKVGNSTLQLEKEVFPLQSKENNHTISK